jgi:Cd(II)/Pb(II)-responsive transcriptional regulator
MKIGELAEMTGTLAETIRFYEKEGLLPPPPRSEGNYRRYDDTHVLRLAFIRHCRCLDMSLDEIRVLLRLRDQPDDDSCGDANALLDEHIAHVGARLGELKELLGELKSLRALCAASSDACGVMEGLERAAIAHDVPAAGAKSKRKAGAHAPSSRASVHRH